MDHATWTNPIAIADEVRRNYGEILLPAEGNRVLRDYGLPALYREGTRDLTSVMSVATFIAGARKAVAL